MAQIELTQNEIDLLREIIKRYLSELSLEIGFSHSHRKDFHEFFERRREFAENFLKRLERETVTGRVEAVSMDRLRVAEILQGLLEEEMQSIAQFFDEEEVEAEVILCEEGERADKLFVLEQGKVCIRSKKGTQYYIETPGKIVGWSYLVPPFLYTATAVTAVPSRFLVIKSPDFYYILHKDPKMGMKVINNLAQVIASRL